MSKFKIGDKVQPTKSYKENYLFGILSEEWTGSIVINPRSSWRTVHVRSTEGEDGAFDEKDLELVTEEKKMQVPFTISGDLITVFIGGTTHFVYSHEKNFQELKDHLKGEHDKEVILKLVDKTADIKRVTEGLVTIEGNQVLYAGELVHNTLAEKLVALVEEGFDVRPWARFMDNLMQNPSYKSRQSLYNFLEHWNAPITPDGCFVAVKNVRSDFTDIHTGKFDNTPGSTVSMPRDQVNDDSSVTCSAGLHACATSYLDHFYSAGGKTVAVKINPRDVVSVPYDYNNAKLRCCQYLVLSEVTREKADGFSSQTLVDEYEDFFGIGLLTTFQK